MAVPTFSVRLHLTNSAGEAWRLHRNCLQFRQARFSQFLCSGICRMPYIGEKTTYADLR